MENLNVGIESQLDTITNEWVKSESFVINSVESKEKYNYFLMLVHCERFTLSVKIKISTLNKRANVNLILGNLITFAALLLLTP